MNLESSAERGPPLPLGELGSRLGDPGEGLRPIEGAYALTPTLSPWERERTADVATLSEQSEGQ